MKIDPCAFLPKAHSEGIITREVDGELLIYDRTRDRAHCLNATAAAIWNLCDGRTPASEIAERLSGGGQQVNEQFVWLALNQLQRSHLLQETKDDLDHVKKTLSPPLKGIGNMSRREIARRVALGAAMALPLVISMTVPTPAQAAVSCGATCHPCNSPIDCCGVCSSIAVPGCGPTTPRCT